MTTSNRFGALAIEITPNPQNLSIDIYYTQKRDEDSGFPILSGLLRSNTSNGENRDRYGADPEFFWSKNDYTEILNVI